MTQRIETNTQPKIVWTYRSKSWANDYDNRWKRTFQVITPCEDD